MYIQSTLAGSAYAQLDNAEIGPDNGTVVPDAAISWVPDAKLAGTLANLRDLIQRTTPLGRAAHGRRPAEDLR